MKLLNALIEKLPAMRRLVSELQQAQADASANQAAYNATCQDLRALRADLAAERERIEHVKEQRNQARNEVGGQREVIVKQSASIEILTRDRENAQRRIAELTLQVGEDKQREERFLRTIDNLNATLNARNGELEDTRAQLTEAQEELARRRRPVLFRREGGYSDIELAEILAGRGSDRAVKAMLQVLDECAVEAMAEAATAPTPPLSGPQPMRGYTVEDRTFSSGGVFALTELKRRLVEKIEPSRREEERAAA